jgi:hypothetical protein
MPQSPFPAAPVSTPKLMDPMSFAEATARAHELHNAYSGASRALNAFIDQFPRGPMNLTPDYVKAMPEYRALYHAMNVSFERLRSYNRRYTKQFARELRAQRAARRAV